MDKKVPFVIKVGSKRYASTLYDLDIVFDDDKLSSRSFDTKIIRYKDGLSRTIYCNNRFFGLRLNRKKRVISQEEVESDSPIIDYRQKNVRRANMRVEELILLNDFDYFLSVTFDDGKVDSKDPKLVMKKLRNWLSDRVKRKGLRYLLIPEYHKKGGRIHAHLLVNDVFELIDSGTRDVEGFSKPLSINTIRKLHIPENLIKHIIYNVTDWKYGFSTAVKVYGDKARMKNYLLKYITKDSEKIFGKRYWFSKNLNIYPVVQFENTFGFYECDSKAYSCCYSDNQFKYLDNMEVWNDDSFSPDRVSQYAEIEI